ncbi:unnamed protein product [Onchocerca flexuosa]|uniref:Uncharacterized protein n=1 Tax=Onchocerca flexuosa TaxID=387005 RepID=A0A183HHA1_9BILA|nr:unnamed protein product [Onchocerca flexuosa]
MNEKEIQSEVARSIRILPTSQLESIPERFYQQTNVDKLISKSFCQMEEKAQISHQFEKYASICSTIPLTSQTSAISETSRRYTTDFKSSLPYKSVQKNEVIDSSTISHESIEYCPRTDVQLISSELSEISSISTECSKIPNCLNLEKKLNLLDTEDVQREQSSLVGEELEMKMNVILMPKQYKSRNERIALEEHQTDQESNRSRSISSLNSFATTTTYESTQELSIIRA